MSLRWGFYSIVDFPSQIIVTSFRGHEIKKKIVNKIQLVFILKNLIQYGFM